MMKKTDIILIVIILAISGLLYFAFFQNPAEESRINIFVDGELVRSESMSDIETPIVIESSHGSNIIKIDSGTVEVTWSDCSSQVCVRTGRISKPGEVIVCLPHHLMVAIAGDQQSEGVDAIAY